METLANEMELEIMEYIIEVKELSEGSVRDGVLTGINEGYFHQEI